MQHLSQIWGLGSTSWSWQDDPLAKIIPYFSNLVDVAAKVGMNLEQKPRLEIQKTI